MPYYLHPSDRPPDPETDCTFRTKQDALAHQREVGSTHQITFEVSSHERRSWRERENDRFRTGAYLRTPWCIDPRFDIEPFFSHLAHLSVGEPGMVAYTPSDEYGIADRQIRTTPGRYLGKFARFLSKPELDRYVAECKARTDSKGPLLAKTEADIVSVYLHGPTSCMTHDIGSSSYPECIVKGRPVHPTIVYADSDLAVAYLGTLDAASARCIVWPDRKRYGRLYGDDTLRRILVRAGYDSGSMQGAKVRAIQTDSGAYVMPFIDGIENATLKGQWFVLDNTGPYCVQSTDGTASTKELTVCANCNEAYDADEEGGDGFCQSCCDDRSRCSSCGESGWSGYFTSIRSRYDDVQLCSDCESRLSVVCAINEEHVFYPRIQLSVAERRTRERAHLSDVCPACVNAGWQYCAEHDKYFNPSDDPCESCRPETDEETEDDHAIAG